jgi:hypothetical protein
MPVVQVNEVVGREGFRDKDANKRYTRVFQVLTSLPTDGAKQVLESPFLPAYGSIWELVTFGGIVLDVDQEAFLVEKRPVQDDADNLQNWTVYCEYVGRGDPTLEPPEIDWSTTKYQKTTQRDWLGNFVANSAGDPYRDGLTRDASRLVVTIKKNVLTWDPATSLGFIDTTNDMVFLAARHPPGFAPGLCKLSDVGASAVWYENNAAIHYWKLVAKVEISPDGWNARKLDEGFQHLVSIPFVGQERLPIYLPTGAKPSSPQPLDGEGSRLPPGGEPQFLHFVPYEPKDWSLLNLDY